MKVRVYTTKLISRAIYKPKNVFAFFRFICSLPYIFLSTTACFSSLWFINPHLG